MITFGKISAKKIAAVWECLGNNVSILNSVVCSLGEGLFLDPTGKVVFWFDIETNRFFSLRDTLVRVWELPCTASAGFCLDDNNLVIASNFGVLKGVICDDILQLDLIFDMALPNHLRTNDGRGDLLGGLWFSSMSRIQGEASGCIYRYYKGEVKEVETGIEIPNSICVHPSGRYMLFSDTAKQMIFSLKLDEDGWAASQAFPAMDLRSTKYFPDGATFDSLGRLIVAMWGVGLVVVYDQNRSPITEIALPTPYITCPGVDPENENILWVTTAAPKDSTDSVFAGKLFRVSIDPSI